MNLATAPFKAFQGYHPDAPEFRCGGCEYLFSANDMVTIGKQVYCHECSWTARCIACDAVRRDTATTPDGPMCPECIAESAESIVEDVLDALFGEPCVTCHLRLVRRGLQCWVCEAKGWFTQREESRKCIRCGQPSGGKPMCSQACEDAERFAGVGA